MEQNMDLKIKIFADGADSKGMLEMNANPLIKGLTTNPTLMRIAGITDYLSFAKEILTHIKEKPISFEVFADENDEMERQANILGALGRNVNIKIPITNTQGVSTKPLVKKLANAGVKLNITAMMTIAQVKHIAPTLSEGPGGYVSVFAGRIADTGVDPVPIMSEIVEYLERFPNIELIWASPREVLNVVQANDIGCHVITVTNDLIKKFSNLKKDLDLFSLETVQMFYNDAISAGFDF
jgi:transaldolase